MAWLHEDCVGPLGPWEMSRLARRGQAMRARLIVLSFVFVAAVVVPVLWFFDLDPFGLFFGAKPLVSIRQEAMFASHFSLALAQAVVLAVAVLSPAFGANAFAEEKERRTLQLLQVSLLSDREIVVGKAMGRFGVIMAAAIAVVPVLALTSLLGGVSVRFLVTTAVAITSTAALGTAIGIEAGCRMSRLVPALFRSGGFTALIIFGLFGLLSFATPFSLLRLVQTSVLTYQELALYIGGFSAAYLVLTIIFLCSAHRHFRRERFPTPKRVEHVLPDGRKRLRVMVRVRNPFGQRRHRIHETYDDKQFEYHRKPQTVWHTNRPWLDDSDDPVLWKERYIQGTIMGKTSIGIARVTIAVAAMICFWFVFAGASEILLELNWSLPRQLRSRESLATGASFAMGLFAIPAALRLAPSVSRERQRHTLDSLLALPIERSTLLWAKTRASIEPTWAWLALAIPAAGLAFLSAGNWFMGLLAIALVTCSAYFLICLGTLLTVICASEVKALRFLLPAVVVVIGLPAVTFSYVNWRYTDDMAVLLASVAAIMTVIGVMSWRRATTMLQGT